MLGFLLGYSQDRLDGGNCNQREAPFSEAGQQACLNYEVLEQCSSEEEPRLQVPLAQNLIPTLRLLDSPGQCPNFSPQILEALSPKPGRPVWSLRVGLKSGVCMTLQIGGFGRCSCQMLLRELGQFSEQGGRPGRRLTVDGLNNWSRIRHRAMAMEPDI